MDRGDGMKQGRVRLSEKVRSREEGKKNERDSKKHTAAHKEEYCYMCKVTQEHTYIKHNRKNN
jgi:hypothetical protein